MGQITQHKNDLSCPWYGSTASLCDPLTVVIIDYCKRRPDLNGINKIHEHLHIYKCSVWEHSPNCFIYNERNTLYKSTSWLTETTDTMCLISKRERAVCGSQSLNLRLIVEAWIISESHVAHWSEVLSVCLTYQLNAMSSSCRSCCSQALGQTRNQLEAYR